MYYKPFKKVQIFFNKQLPSITSHRNFPLSAEPFQKPCSLSLVISSKTTTSPRRPAPRTRVRTRAVQFWGSDTDLPVTWRGRRKEVVRGAEGGPRAGGCRSCPWWCRARLGSPARWRLLPSATTATPEKKGMEGVVLL